MLLKEISIFKMIIFISACFNIYAAFFPHKLKPNGVPVNLNHFLDTFFITDFIICLGIGKYLRPWREVFITKEIKKTYKIHGTTIEKTTKNYPILLPITVALITASGAIIAALLKK